MILKRENRPKFEMLTLSSIIFGLLKMQLFSVKIMLIWEGSNFSLELRWYKNNSTESRWMFVLKLPPFFTRLNGEGKMAAISKLTLIWTPSSRSYIVFALVISIMWTLLKLKNLLSKNDSVWGINYLSNFTRKASQYRNLNQRKWLTQRVKHGRNGSASAAWLLVVQK